MTGFSTPIFGVSWEAPTSDVEVARRVVAFLEDRRVLYVPMEAEIRDHCISSVIEIRQFLTNVLGEDGFRPELADSLRAMRAACRKFCAEVEAGGGRWGGLWVSGLQDYVLNQALGELRGVFGVQAGQVAVRYGLDVEEGLASTLPVPDEP